MVEGPFARAAWRVLDAQHFGVPQRRERVFVVIGFGAGADPAEILLEWESLRRDPAAGERAGEDPAGTLGGGARSRGGYSTDDIPLVGEAYGRNNTSGPIDIAAALNAHGGPHGRMDFETETFVVGSLDASGGGADENDAEQGRLLPIAFNARQDTEVYGDIAGTLDVGSPQGQAIAFDTTQITSRANRSHPQPGDPCHPLAAGAHPPAIVFSSKDHGADAGEIAPTLRAMNHAGSHANAGGQVAIATSQYGVRRLTPRECERLQDLPDDHTLIPWRGRPAEECPDGPRYRACGNAMNRRVMDWIGRRLAASLRGEAV